MVKPKSSELVAAPSTPSSMLDVSDIGSVGTPTLNKGLGSEEPSPGNSSVSSLGANVTPSQFQGRGRPHKPITKLDYSDFPINGTPDEQERWFKVKQTRNWRYNVLTSPEESAYHAREREHTRNYYHVKKKEDASASADSQNSSQGSDDKDGLDGIEYIDDDVDNSHTKKQEQSQLR